MPLAKQTLRYLLFVGLLVSSVSCDQGTKVWARHTLSGHADNSVIPCFWEFHLAQNPGCAFSLFRDLPGGRYFLSVVGLVLLVALFVWLRRLSDGRWLPVAALALIAGGAVGNLFDRVAFGRVTDFVFWHWHERPWPVFNIADALLLVGGLLMVGALRSTAPAQTPGSARTR